MKKKILVSLLIVIGILLVAVAAYVIYMQCQYYRIEDNLSIETENNQEEVVQAGTEYKIMTYNIGFGAYSQDYSFFMDTGEMKDGTQTRGHYGKGMSAEDVEKNTSGCIERVKEQNPDFVFLQEVDVKADRSYEINQRDEILNSLPEYGSVFANNFHSAYLPVPPWDPHGAVNAGMLTLSKYHIDSNVRRQFPVSDAFITKFTDLDRCFVVSRCPVSNGKELVLINVHLSAYDEGGKIRAKQLELLNQVLAQEGEKGNYIIVGGDFNHDIADTIEAFPSEQKIPPWVFQLSDESLAEGFHFVKAENCMQVPTCRGADIPYEKGVDYTVVVDGFIVSDNVKASAQNIDGEFLYSDHNPVVLTFSVGE